MTTREYARQVSVVQAACSGGDWMVLRRVLHPYLRFTDPSGRTTRGRTKVIDLLRTGDALGEPEELVLRDDQVYVWVCARG